MTLRDWRGDIHKLSCISESGNRLMKKSLALIMASFCCCAITEGQVPELPNLTLNFRDVTATKLTPGFAENSVGNEKHIAFADYDNDGDLDVAMAVQLGDFGQRHNKLYRNDSGVLMDLAGSEVMPEFSITDNSCTALFEDFDDDGWADLIIVCDSNSGSSTPTAPGTTKYYRNVNGSHFVNETFRLNGLVGAASFGAAADVDGNGLLDIILCDHPNINQDKIAFNAFFGGAPGEFDDLTNTHLPIDNEYGKHVDTADMNGDGKVDILMASHGSDRSFIYYNNNEGAGSSDGDFRYVGLGASTEFPSTVGGGIDERALVPCDFNNDGLMDIYFANEGGFGLPYSDAIYVNVGNDANNKAIFVPQPILPDLNDETMKVTVSDLDGDGRDDLIVMAKDRRPYIFRNTSENGAVSFVEWTHPVLTVQTHHGWEAAARQLTGSERPDLLVGAFHGDFLFEGVPSITMDSGGVDDGPFLLPDFHGQDPIAIVGQVGVGQQKLLVANEMPQGARISVLLRSFGDLAVTAEIDGQQIASSSNQGHGSDEWLEFELQNAGQIVFKVSGHALSFDGNADGIVNLLDVGYFIDCLTGNSAFCDPFDLNDDGNINLSFVAPFVEAVSNVKMQQDFVVEILSRDD